MAPEPAPQELLSQSEALWHAKPVVRAHVPLVELVPRPQVPEGPHCASLWQTKPAMQLPVFAPLPRSQVPDLP